MARDLPISKFKEIESCKKNSNKFLKAKINTSNEISDNSFENENDNSYGKEGGEYSNQVDNSSEDRDKGRIYFVLS